MLASGLPGAPELNMKLCDLTPSEHEHVAAILADLREHFHVWPTEPGNEWHLVDFAYYEGCGRQDHCRETLRVAAPLVLGNHLVNNYGCNWCMLSRGGEWHWAVNHTALSSPIDLYGLDDHPMLDPYEHDAELEPFEPGEGAHESLYAIVRLLNRP